MPNMSYCRFQNTNRDLSDCERALEDLAAGQSPPLSSDELDAAKGLLRRAVIMLEQLAEQAGEEVAELVDDGRKLDAILDRLNAAAGEG